MAANIKKSGNSGAVKFFRDIRTELRKIVWPNKKELINYTIVVIVFSLVVAFFIGIIDLGFSAGFQYLIS
ncbi:MAG: preprotein translocase subunit SecE [Firmicutes bacterium]|nr:preprotein translocase subunit SecE [Bacillota bacterium]MDD4693323.1 preprotein translocase subunit SecE [Bacillota bacterium]